MGLFEALKILQSFHAFGCLAVLLKTLIRSQPRKETSFWFPEGNTFFKYALLHLVAVYTNFKHRQLFWTCYTS